MNVKRGDTPSSESEEERVLRSGLHVNPLSTKAMSRIRTATETLPTKRIV